MTEKEQRDLIVTARPMETVHDVESFFRDCWSFFKGGFHPDTSGATYVEYASGKPTFTATQAKAFDQNIEKAFAATERLHVDVYKVALEAMHDWEKEA